MRAEVCVLERHDFTMWRAEYEGGRAASALPYGIEALADRFVLTHRDVRPSRRLRDVSADLAYWTDREVLEVVASLPAIRKADVCLSVFEDFGLTYSSLRRFVALPPVVVIGCWLSQRLLTFAHRQRDGLRNLARRSEALVVFSENQIELVRNRLDLAPGLLHVVDFGVSSDWFSPHGAHDDYVAVVGQDVGRDWPTFFAAAAADPSVRYRVAAYESDFTQLNPPPNVEWLGGLSPVAYRDLLRQATATVVCTHPLAYPTGQSVMLESLSCGTPVVVTQSRAMARYAELTGALTHEPGDASALATQTRRLLGDHALRADLSDQGRRSVVDHFDARSMWRSIAAIIDAVHSASPTKSGKPGRRRRP